MRQMIFICLQLSRLQTAKIRIVIQIYSSLFFFSTLFSDFLAKMQEIALADFTVVSYSIKATITALSFWAEDVCSASQYGVIVACDVMITYNVSFVRVVRGVSLKL